MEVKIPLDIKNVETLQVEKSESGAYLITVESTQESTNCRKCGKELYHFHGYDKPITLRHLPILGTPVYIQLRPKRYRCFDCEHHPTSTQRLEWYDPRRPHTKAFEEHILYQLINSTISDVHLKEKLGYQAVVGIACHLLSKEVNWNDVKRIGKLGIDEISLKKGHKDFVVIITARRKNTSP